jgi:hypothetical protein
MSSLRGLEVVSRSWMKPGTVISLKENGILKVLAD